MKVNLKVTAAASQTEVLILLKIVLETAKELLRMQILVRKRRRKEIYVQSNRTTQPKRNRKARCQMGKR